LISTIGFEWQPMATFH